MQSLRILPVALFTIILCSSFLIVDRLSSNDEFEQMLALFADAELPLEFDAASVAAKKMTYTPKNYNAIRLKSDLIEKFIPLPERSRFSRSGPPVMNPMMKFEATENIYALIFENQNRYGGGSIECATIDKKGNFINRKKLIGRSQNVFASIDKEGLIELHSTNWYKKQKGEEAKEIKFFKISDKGNFKDFTEYVTSARASLD